MNGNSRFFRPARIIFCVFIFFSVTSFAAGQEGPGKKRITNSLGMEFVLVKPGTFLMGSPRDETHRDRDEVRHEVTLTRPYYMQATEVTIEQWQSVMGKKFFGRRKGSPDQPVTKVSWYDCMDFIEKLNKKGEGTYRLPTEAEWEYGCRAGTQSAYFWGETMNCGHAMCCNNPLKCEKCIPQVRSMGLPVGEPAPVKSYQPNAWGLYDMHGNVWEWCQDWYGAYETGKTTDPRGPENGDKRVRRGGSWYKYGWYGRSANRNLGHPAIKLDTTGFRVVREVD